MTPSILAALSWTALSTMNAPSIQASPGIAQVGIEPGEAVELTLDEGGSSSETARVRAGPLSRFEAAAVWHLTNGAYRDASGPNAAPIVAGDHGIPQPPPVQQGVVRAKLIALGSSGTLLILENGYRTGIRYRATIRTAGRESPTDVCQVLPMLYSFEHWPYAIEHIQLSHIQRVPILEGQPPVCE